MWDVQDMRCSGCGMFEMQDVLDVTFLECKMLWVRDVLDARSSGCGMFKI